MNLYFCADLFLGATSIPLSIEMTTLAGPPSLTVLVQGPDNARQVTNLDLREVCTVQLRENEEALANRTERVNEYIQETDAAYDLSNTLVTDPRVNRTKQEEIATLLGRLTAFNTQYQADLQALSGNLETLEQTQVNENVPVFEATDKRLKDAIASLKSAQVQLQMKLGTAHSALLTIRDENEQAIETLLNDPNLNVDHADADGGKTLLQKVIERRNQYKLRRLLEKGANANLARQDRESPLQTAIKTGNEIAIDILLEHKADPNKKYASYYNCQVTALQTVLIECSDEECSDEYKQFFSRMIRKFLEKGANINVRSSEGKTALHYGVCTWNIGIVNSLLNAEADVNAIDNEGMTVLDTSIKDTEHCFFNDIKTHNRKDTIMPVIKLLRAHGAYCASKDLIIKNTDLRKEDIDFLEKGIWSSPYVEE